MDNMIMLDEVIYQDGALMKGYLNVGKKPGGDCVRIPVITMGGGDGPVLLVDACNHGDEYEGTEAILAVVEFLQNMRFTGTFIGVPALNLEAFSVGDRVSPFDYVNLNRVYPGNPESFISQRVAYTYMDRLVKIADYLISLHGGGTALHLHPIVGYLPGEDDVSRKSCEMARTFGTELLWKMQNLPFDGVSTIEAAKLGIPGIIPEVGSHCGRLYDRQKNVGIVYQGILNVMDLLGMLPEQPAGAAVKGTKPPEQVTLEMHYLHTPTGGIHQPLKGPKERVQKNELLARITDVFGEEIVGIRAPFDGVVIGFYSVPVINPGDWSYMIGKILS